MANINPYIVNEIIMNDPDVKKAEEKDRIRKETYKEYYKTTKPKGIIEYIKYILSQI